MAKFNDPLVVQRIKDGVATCWHASAKQAEEIALDDLIPIARFGDPIYPVLTPIDAVENAPGDKLWHTLIQADNYHALQLLEYLYPLYLEIDSPLTHLRLSCKHHFGG